MLNGEKMKLRNTTTISASLIRKTKKFSSFFGVLGGSWRASAPSLAVWFIVASMFGRCPCVKPWPCGRGAGIGDRPMQAKHRCSRWTKRLTASLGTAGGAAAAERLSELFAGDPGGSTRLSTRLELPGGGMLFDWSKTHLDPAHLRGVRRAGRSDGFRRQARGAVRRARWSTPPRAAPPNTPPSAGSARRAASRKPRRSTAGCARWSRRSTPARWARSGT